jgi:ethanolamine ammonia-lyase small subunit
VKSTINDQIETSDMSSTKNGVTENSWHLLREFTAARISLGRSGVSIPTSEMLAFQLAHAQARDAVHTPLDFEDLQKQLSELVTQFPKLISSKPITLHSQASDRTEYLQRPDLGRSLDQQSVTKLQKVTSQYIYNLAIVVADGLSATAIYQNALPFIQLLLEALQQDEQPWTIAPITLVEQGRVAISDEVGELLNADLVLMLIGERPGLSSPDSMGLYLTWAPRVGLNDSSRNCISNVRPQGLVYKAAVQKAIYLLRESRRLKLSGVNLKDRSMAIEKDKTTGDTIEHDKHSSPTHFLSE